MGYYWKLTPISETMVAICTYSLLRRYHYSPVSDPRVHTIFGCWAAATIIWLYLWCARCHARSYHPTAYWTGLAVHIIPWINRDADQLFPTLFLMVQTFLSIFSIHWSITSLDLGSTHRLYRLPFIGHHDINEWSSYAEGPNKHCLASLDTNHPFSHVANLLNTPANHFLIVMVTHLIFTWLHSSPP